jgi:1-acyl-sn-glycerol-3-phosphate acyltransferase
MAGGIIKRTGLEHLEEGKNYVFLCNHASWGDIVVIFYSIRRMVRFLAKKELRKLPFIGLVMEKMGMIFVDRGNSKAAAIAVKEALERIKEGVNLIAFPEGTRSLTGKLGPFKKGVFLIAIKSEIDIIPVGICQVQKVWALDNFSFRPGVIKVNIGKPISTIGYDEHNVHELMELVRNQVLVLSEGE